MIAPRLLVPFAIAVLFIGGGWTLRNQLAADRQGEWVKVTRGDLATGVDVTGALASADARSFGPPRRRLARPWIPSRQAQTSKWVMLLNSLKRVSISSGVSRNNRPRPNSSTAKLAITEP